MLSEIYNNRYRCGECRFLDGKCTTSAIEAKYGSAGIPACNEFIGRTKMRTINDVASDAVKCYDNEDCVKELIAEYINGRNCGSCSVMNCEILNAIANTGTIRIVDFGCNRWEDINA